jgi:hypothetical protein
MKLTPSQHLRMAAVMDELSKKADDPTLKERRLQLANAHRILARKAAEQELRSAVSRHRPNRVGRRPFG